jgi:hypothetical protein
MGDFTAIKDVTETVLGLLRAQVPAELVAADHITVASPADVETDTSPRLLLFLYHVAVNPYLRNSPRMSPPPQEPMSPPLMVNLFYLVVPYATTRETECLILGKVMQIFDSNPALGGSHLSGSLEGGEELNLVNLNLTVEQLLRIWEALTDKPYKLSLAYEVSPVPMQTSLAPNQVHSVADRVMPMR